MLSCTAPPAGPGGTFTVRIDSCPGAYIRIEVEDDGGPWLVPAPDPGSGRGLDIVRVLAADWGPLPAPRAVPSGLGSVGPAASTAGASPGMPGYPWWRTERPERSGPYRSPAVGAQIGRVRALPGKRL